MTTKFHPNPSLLFEIACSQKDRQTGVNNLRPPSVVEVIPTEAAVVATDQASRDPKQSA